MAGKNRKILLTIILSVSSFYFMQPHVTTANSLKQQIQEAREKTSEIKDKRSNLQEDIQGKQHEISEIRSDQEQLKQEIKRIDLAVAETRSNIRTKEAEIKETEAAIKKLEAEIVELKQRIEKRDEILKTRVRSVQQNGGMINYLDVLLGAKSFGDFIDRASAVTIIVNQDKEILQKHIKEKQLLEDKKNKVASMLEELKAQRTELQELEAQLVAQRKEKDAIMAELKEREDHIEEQLLEVEEQEEILAKQQAAMQKLVKQLQEHERRKQEAIKRGEKPPITDGTFMRPANGPITSNYGSRWGKLHAGVDIGKRGSDVPVVAAADGIVFRSYYSSSYGNVVFITHNVSGQVYTTVYAHMESRSVSEGELVKKGTTLGYMGNTGHSFGAHLHFELHKGEWNITKSNSVDPTKYVDF